MWETWVQPLGWEYPVEKGKATRSCSGLENLMDTGAWQATGHGVPKSWTQLSCFDSQQGGASCTQGRAENEV